MPLLMIDSMVASVVNVRGNNVVDVVNNESFSVGAVDNYFAPSS